MCDTAASLVSGEHGILALGSHRNRNEEYNNVSVEDGNGAGEMEGTEWHTFGCYLKPKRAPPTRLNAKLKHELTRMFKEGEKTTRAMKGKNKYTPARALTELQAMKQTSGLRMFSSTLDHGDLPTTDKIVSFWGRYRTTKKKHAEIAAATKNDIEEWVESALDPHNPPVGDDSINTGNDDVDTGSSVEPLLASASNVFHEKTFVLDGCFIEAGGVDHVKSLIVDAGGILKLRLSKKMGCHPRSYMVPRGLTS